MLLRYRGIFCNVLHSQGNDRAPETTSLDINHIGTLRTGCVESAPHLKIEFPTLASISA